MSACILFRNRSYAAATSFVLLTNLVVYTTILAMPFFIEEVQGKGHGASASDGISGSPGRASARMSRSDTWRHHWQRWDWVWGSA